MRMLGNLQRLVCLHHGTVRLVVSFSQWIHLKSIEYWRTFLLYLCWQTAESCEFSLRLWTWRNISIGCFQLRKTFWSAWSVSVLNRTMWVIWSQGKDVRLQVIAFLQSFLVLDSRRHCVTYSCQSILRWKGMSKSHLCLLCLLQASLHCLNW